MLLLLDIPKPDVIDTLPPEVQQGLGIVAAVTLVAGLLVWSCGVKLARLSVAIALGLGGAALATWLLPRFIDLTPLAAGIIGFVAGSLLGLFTFRLLQGLTLALCLGIAVAALYHQWHVPHEIAATQVSTRAADLLRPTAGFPAEPATNPDARRFDLSALLKTAGDAINSVPPAHQKRMLIVGLGTAAVALLVAFAFPWFTTWIITSVVGSLMLLVGSHALARLYAPSFEAFFPAQTIPRYLLLTFLVLLGLLIQYRLFPPPADKPRKQTKPPEPEPA